MPREVEIPILIVLIIITAYFYIKERKKSYRAAKALDEQSKVEKEEPAKFCITVHIEGMMCEKCAARVKGALQKFGEITISVEEKSATILCDEMPDTEEIKNVIEELGYEVTEIE